MRVLIGYIGASDPTLHVVTQRNLISMTAWRHGHEVRAVYTERSAGKSVGWPELDKAIDHARQMDALLVVVNPGRLTHLSLRFWAKLARADVGIVLHGKLTPPDEIKAIAAAAR